MELIQKVLGVEPRVNRRDGRATRVLCVGKLISRFIMATCGKGSDNQRMPKEILYGPNLQALETLVSYMILGDGNIDQDGVHYNTISKQLAFDLRIAVIRLGYRPRILLNKRKKNGFVAGHHKQSVFKPI